MCMITDDNYEPIAKPVDVIIKGFNDLSHHGARTMPDGVSVTNNTLIYDCRIHVLNRVRRVTLYYEPYKMEWKISTG